MNARAVPVHKLALTLTALLLAVFIAATWLYARFGHALVLRVFEVNQTFRAQRSNGAMTELHLADYLRVDPASVDMRGLLVDAQIENGRAASAVETALAGLAYAPADGHVPALLLLVRARIAAGSLEKAALEIAEVVDDAPESAEAQYEWARICAARGEFPEMRASFERLAAAGDEASTSQFKAGRESARKRIQRLTALGREHLSNPESIEFARALMLAGDLDQALGLLARVDDFGERNADARFWRGVYEEERGNRDSAREFYRAAARWIDPLAIAAIGRLQGG